MASSGIKLQSLLCKFKNQYKEEIAKKKIIKNYTHDISLEEQLERRYIFQFRNNTQHIYSVTDSDTNSAEIIVNTELNVTKIHDYLDNASMDNIQKGYISSVYNAEFCNENWLNNIYLMDVVYHNFINANDKVIIKSLHISNEPNSELSAINHFIFNNSASELVGAEWSWLNIVNPMRIMDKMYILNKMYKSKLLYLLDNSMSKVNNINFIINETTEKLNKINLLLVNELDNKFTIKEHIAYAALSIKLLEINSIFIIKVPNIEHWNTSFINVLLLYSMIFSEVYIFKFSLITSKTYLICKNKKKIANESLYKRLIFLLNDTEFIDQNIFSKKIFEIESVKTWLNNILSIKNVILNPPELLTNIVFKDILDIVDNKLKINTELFFNN